MTEVDIAELAEAIRGTHGCKAKYLHAAPVTERHGGDTAWWGLVHVFEVEHPKAKRAYAWSYVVDQKTQRRRFLTILGVPPINSPADAVRAAIASGQQT